ncbi:MAG TPA: hypothetical protein VGD42_05400 [Lysobacter sp.]
MDRTTFAMRRHGARFVATALALLLGLLPVATAVAAETPEAFVTRSVAAVQRDGLGAIAGFVHPDEAARFKAMLMPVLDVGPGSEVDRMTRAMFGADAATVRAMAPADVMRAVLDTMARQAQGAGAPLQIGDRQVLGSVREGEVVHVVTRGSATVGELSITKVEVTSVRPLGDSWGLMLDGDIEGLARMLAAGASGARGTDAPAAPPRREPRE